jgi:hypothetical protein
MVLRDLHAVQFGLDPTAPIQASKLDWALCGVLLEMCTTIAEDLKACLDAEPPEDSATPAPKDKKSSSKRQKKLTGRYGCQV